MDNMGIGIYGGEGCRGKRKVVCYPAGGGRASGVVAHARRRRPTTCIPWPQPESLTLTPNHPAAGQRRRPPHTQSPNHGQNHHIHRTRVVIPNPPTLLVLRLSPQGLNRPRKCRYCSAGHTPEITRQIETAKLLQRNNLLFSYVIIMHTSSCSDSTTNNSC